MSAGGRTARAGAGFTVTSAGIGTRTTAGAGRRSITGAGIAPFFTAGTGCPATRGARHGSCGAPTTITPAGRRCRRAPTTCTASGTTWGGSHVGFSFGFGLGHGWFTYCDYAYLRHRRMHHHRVADNRVAIIHNETTVVNNYVTENNTTIINAGIPPAVIAEKTREPVQKMRIRELDLEIESIARVGQIDANGKTMAVYRPQVPTLPDTPGEKPGGRTPVTKNPTPEDSSADKPEADQKILKQYGNGTSVANRSKITGRLTPGILARPLGRSYTLPRSSGAIAASPSPTGLTKPGRGASASAKPDASGSRTLKSTFSAPSKSRTTPSRPSARKSYSRSSPRVNTTRKPGPSATSRLVTPSTRSSATPSRAWQQRPSPSYSAPARRDARWLPSQPRGPRACQAHARSLRATAHRHAVTRRRDSPVPHPRGVTGLRQHHARLLHGPPGHRHVQLPADPTPLLPEVTRHLQKYSAPSRSAPSRSYSPPAPSAPPSSSGGGSSSGSSGSSGGGGKDPR